MHFSLDNKSEYRYLHNSAILNQKDADPVRSGEGTDVDVPFQGELATEPWSGFF
jgi:hypothetical protein